MDEDEKDKKQPELDKKEVSERKQKLNRIKQNISVTVKNKPTGNWGKFQTFLKNMPTPGSINFPLIVLILLFFILIEANGKTRLNWLFDTIVGNAYLVEPPATTNTTPINPVPSDGKTPQTIPSNPTNPNYPVSLVTSNLSILEHEEMYT